MFVQPDYSDQQNQQDYHKVNPENVIREYRSRHDPTTRPTIDTFMWEQFRGLLQWLAQSSLS
jgi:hypothetical protein